MTQAAAAAAAAAAAVQAATNTTEFLSHLHKQAEFDLIAKNHLDLYAENLLSANDARRNNNEKLRTVNYNNNNNDTTLNDANKHSGSQKPMNIKSEGPKNSRSADGNRMQKLFQVSKNLHNYAQVKRLLSSHVPQIPHFILNELLKFTYIAHLLPTAECLSISVCVLMRNRFQAQPHNNQNLGK